MPFKWFCVFTAQDFSENWCLCGTPGPQIMLMAKNKILNKYKFSLTRPLKLKYILNMNKQKEPNLRV